MNQMYSEILKKFQKEIQKDQVEIIRDKSILGVLELEKNSLDWIYINGNHEYPFVLEDLRLSFEKVKKGGYITGDDLNWINPKGIKTIQLALKKFLKEHPKLNLIILENNQYCI